MKKKGVVLPDSEIDSWDLTMCGNRPQQFVYADWTEWPKIAQKSGKYRNLLN